MRDRWAVLLVMAVGLVVTGGSTNLSAAGVNTPGGPGNEAAKSFVLTYTKILNENDPSRLAAILELPTDSAGVQERIRQFGGRDLRVDNVAVKAMGGGLFGVKVVAHEQSSGKAVAIPELLSWTGDAWRFGPAPPSTGPPAPRPTCHCLTK